MKNSIRLRRSRQAFGGWRRAALAAGLVAGAGGAVPAGAQATPRPNIVWISLEDLSPDLGCYGAVGVHTPQMDDVARRGVRFEQAFATAGVCAPSRSAIITGAHQMTLGTQHMRSTMPKPAGIKTLPEVMRAHGYYCSNNSKQDYNFSGAGMWDDSSGKAHWRNRPSGAPFFSVFNLTTTHEGSTWQLQRGAAELRKRGLEKHILAPTAVRVPPIYVDTPVVREHLANYYNLISVADAQVGDILQGLKEDGLAEDTIVFVWGDHGRGLPRGKFWLYTLSNRVPLIVQVPPKLRASLPGATSAVDRHLRSLLDLYPSTLQAAGIPVPRHAAGRSLFEAGAADRVLLAGRDRLGFRQDLSRAVRTKEWLYIRNFIHDGAYVSRHSSGWYLARSPIQAEMWRHADHLNRHQAFFSEEPRPAEELYAVGVDADETRNLVHAPDYARVLGEMRAALARSQEAVKDSGFTPEFELFQTLTAMAKRGESVFDAGFPGWPAPPAWVRQPPQARSLAMLLREVTAEPVSQRYWALREVINQSHLVGEKELAALAPLLRDASVDVRLQAVRLFALKARYGDVVDVLAADLDHAYAWARTVALGIVDELPLEVARRLLEPVKRARDGGYVQMIRPYLVNKLSPTKAPAKPTP